MLHRLHLKARVRDMAFSHDDGVLAVTHKRHCQLWLAPARRRRELAPFTKLQTFGGGQQKGANFSTFKAHISASFHSFQLIFGRVIISSQVLVR